jgi:hypothetical protein
VSNVEHGKSSRRRFVRRVLGLGAAAGAASLTLSSTDRSLIHLAQANSGSGLAVQIDGYNYGSWMTQVFSPITSPSGMIIPAFGGVANSPNGITYGVSGRALSDQGVGVYGTAAAYSGFTCGVQGDSDSPDGKGVYGHATATSRVSTSGANYGVYGQSDLWDGARGVYGYATAHSGQTYGVQGQSLSSAGIGVDGYAGGIGLRGRAMTVSAIPIVAQAASGQTASIQEWQNTSGTPLAVVDASGNLGVGTTAPLRSVHLQGSNACFRMDRNKDSSAFILTRTSSDFNTVWKTFYVGVDASDVDNGSFFIGDRHNQTSGASEKRLIIDNAGNIVPPTTNTGSIGTSSLKWANIYCTNIYHSDLMYENGVRTSEDGDGIAFYNPQGVKIAVLDREGNFYVKGRVVEGLPS